MKINQINAYTDIQRISARRVQKNTSFKGNESNFNDNNKYQTNILNDPTRTITKIRKINKKQAAETKNNPISNNSQVTKNTLEKSANATQETIDTANNIICNSIPLGCPVGTLNLVDTIKEINDVEPKSLKMHIPYARALLYGRDDKRDLANIYYKNTIYDTTYDFSECKKQVFKALEKIKEEDENPKRVGFKNDICLREFNDVCNKVMQRAKNTHDKDIEKETYYYISKLYNYIGFDSFQDYLFASNINAAENSHNHKIQKTVINDNFLKPILDEKIAIERYNFMLSRKQNYTEQELTDAKEKIKQTSASIPSSMVFYGDLDTKKNPLAQKIAEKANCHLEIIPADIDNYEKNIKDIAQKSQERYLKTGQRTIVLVNHAQDYFSGYRFSAAAGNRGITRTAVENGCSKLPNIGMPNLDGAALTFFFAVDNPMDMLDRDTSGIIYKNTPQYIISADTTSNNTYSFNLFGDKGLEIHKLDADKNGNTQIRKAVISKFDDGNHVLFPNYSFDYPQLKINLANISKVDEQWVENHPANVENIINAATKGSTIPIETLNELLPSAKSKADAINALLANKENFLKEADAQHDYETSIYIDRILAFTRYLYKHGNENLLQEAYKAIIKYGTPQDIKKFEHNSVFLS